MSSIKAFDTLISSLNLHEERDIILESTLTKFSDGELIWVDLGCKGIEELPEGLFDATPNLQYVGLYGNLLKSLRPNIFACLKHLKYLDLGENQLTEIPENIFESNTELEFLWLYGNQLGAITKNHLAPLRNLKELNLNDNRLTDFSVSWVSHMRNLTRLELALNNIASLDPDEFGNFERLKTVVFNTTVNGNIKIVNLLSEEYKKLPERTDKFVLVTGLMGSGKSSLMRANSLSKVDYAEPLPDDNIFYDNIFGYEYKDGAVVNFFEVDGPTVKTWVKFIKRSVTVIMVVRLKMLQTRTEELCDLYNHIYNELAPGSKLVIVINTYSGRPRELIRKYCDVADEVKVLSITFSKFRPRLGGIPTVEFDEDELNRIFLEAIEDI